MPNVAVSAHPRPALPRWRCDERGSLRDQEDRRGIPNGAESTRPGLDCHAGVLDKGLCEIETTVGGRKMEQSGPTLDLGLPHRRGTV